MREWTKRIERRKGEKPTLFLGFCPRGACPRSLSSSNSPLYCHHHRQRGVCPCSLSSSNNGAKVMRINGRGICPCSLSSSY